MMVFVYLFFVYTIFICNYVNTVRRSPSDPLTMIAFIDNGYDDKKILWFDYP